MALRNQPYIPLYVQDYLTDERLNMCSAATQGIYIKIMCLFHKSEQYGGILLKQKDKQNASTTLNFACKLAKLLPFNLQEIECAINELLEEKVLIIDGDFMFQKRMIKDNAISEKRATAGKRGGLKSKKNAPKFANDFAQAKPKAKTKQNTEYENESEYDNEYDNNKGGMGEKECEFEIVESEEIAFEKFRKKYQGTKRGAKTEFENFKKKCKDWKQIAAILEQNLDRQIEERKTLEQRGCFTPQWKNLQTYINNRAWEETYQSQKHEARNTKSTTRTGISENYKRSIVERMVGGSSNTQMQPN